jgi:hypothetical protein
VAGKLVVAMQEIEHDSNLLVDYCLTAIVALSIPCDNQVKNDSTGEAEG